jgi:hypothetical protein
MKSFMGVGGDFQDIEFCDTSLIDPNSGGSRHYQWWLAFSEGKRFYVPRVAALNGQEVRFNVEELLAEANKLFQAHGTQYPTASDFGRKSLDKIVKRGAMSFGKAVMATRAVNSVLAHKGVRDGNKNLIQIGRHEIVMAGYRIEGLSAALGRFAQLTSGQTESEGASEFLAREAGVSASIIEGLKTDDGKFVVFATAHAIIHALLRNRHQFGISNEAGEQTFLRLGPPPGTPYNRLDLKLSYPETDDPNFPYRTAQTPHPDNPFKWAA